jgi:hypothetical protein
MKPIIDLHSNKQNKSLFLLPLFAILIIFVMFSPSLAATYYVDVTNGNDSNPGVSESTPWETINKVNTSSFNGDDQILFKRGEVWREQLNVPSSGTYGHLIKFGAYGTGNDPVFSGADLVSTPWSGYSTTGAVWTSPLTNKPDMVWFDEVHGNIKNSIGALVADKDFYHESGNLYVYSSSDPTTRDIEISSRSYGISTNDKDYLHFENLGLTGTKEWGAGIAINGSQYVTVDNCRLYNNFYVGVKGLGANYGRLTLSNNTIYDNGGSGITLWDGWGGYIDVGYNTITANTVYDNGWRDVESYGIHGTFSNSTISKNTIYNQSLGAVSHAIYCHGIYTSSGAGSGTVIDNNTTYGNTHGSGIKLTGNGIVRYNLSYGNYRAGIQVGTNGANNVTYDVYYNICYGNQYGLAQLDKNSGNINLHIYHNSFYNNTNTSESAGTREIMIGDNLTSLVVKNNILSGTSEKAFAGAVQSAMTWDHNLISHANIYYDSRVLSWAQWQAFGFDANGINSNPLFTNAAENNFHLLSTSPASKTGADVGLTLDYEGNPVKNPPNIGAYDNQYSNLSAPRGFRMISPQ